METIIFNRFKKSIMPIAIGLFILLSGCYDDHYYHNNNNTDYPELVSAKVTNDAKDQVIATFSKNIITDAKGFTIKVENFKVEIIQVAGSGTGTLNFKISSAIHYRQDVTIEYNATEGNAKDDNGLYLKSFSQRNVSNQIIQQNLAINLPTIPPDYKNERVWLIIRTDEPSDNWAYEYKSAGINEQLSAVPTKTPFDLIVFITANPDWRPHMPFDSGYYATMLNQTDENLQMKVVRWDLGDAILGTDMGQLIEVNAGLDNSNYQNAYTLKTDGKDYLEGNINEDGELWYKFYADNSAEYLVSVIDNFTDANDFSGIVEAVLMDRYRIAFENLSPAISGYPILFNGKGEDVYLDVTVAKRGGQPGTFQIQVVKQ